MDIISRQTAKQWRQEWLMELVEVATTKINEEIPHVFDPDSKNLNIKINISIPEVILPDIMEILRHSEWPPLSYIGGVLTLRSI